MGKNHMQFCKLMRLTALLFLIGGGPAVGGDLLDLVVPVYQVRDASMKEALEELREWGLLVGFEELSTESDRRISITLYGASIRSILDALTSGQRGYRWQRYQSRLSPGSDLVIVNIMPVHALEDGQSVMNLKVREFKWSNIRPSIDLLRLHELVPELRSLYREVAAAGSAGSRIFGVGKSPLGDFAISAVFRNLTLREILNEVSLRTGTSWTYERTSSPWPHRWRTF